MAKSDKLKTIELQAAFERGKNDAKAGRSMNPYGASLGGFFTDSDHTREKRRAWEEGQATVKASKKK